MNVKLLCEPGWQFLNYSNFQRKTFYVSLYISDCTLAVRQRATCHKGSGKVTEKK